MLVMAMDSGSRYDYLSVNADFVVVVQANGSVVLMMQKWLMLPLLVWSKLEVVLYFDRATVFHSI